MTKDEIVGKVKLELLPETAVWLRRLLENMQIQGTPASVRKLLIYNDEVLAQLPGSEEETAA